MIATLTKPMTIEEFLELPDPDDGSKLELIHGEVIVVSRAKPRHCYVCSKIDRRIGNYIEANNLGWTFSNDAGVILGEDSLVGPDVGFWSIQRVPSVPDDYFEIPPDLAVEVLSPSDRRSQVREKIRLYVENGVPLVWLVDPDTRTVTVYSGSLRGIELDEAEPIDGGEVLPGFTCKVAEFFK